jgi:hypothetical protein
LKQYRSKTKKSRKSRKHEGRNHFLLLTRYLKAVLTVGTDGVDTSDENAIERGTGKKGRFLQALNARFLLAEMQDHVRKTIPIHILKVPSAMLLHRRIRSKPDTQGVNPGYIECGGSKNRDWDRPPIVKIDLRSEKPEGTFLIVKPRL